MNNQTQLVRNAINIFIIVAVSISLFQQLIHTNQKPLPIPGAITPNGEPIPSQPTGPKIQGIRLQSSDKFHTPLKQLLAKNNLNIEITQFQFQGNQYWMNLAVNWGHIVLIFFFMSKHKSETDQTKKKQIMIVGALAVVAWFYFSPQLKPQRFALEVHGSKVYEKDYLNDQEVIGVLNEYEFQIDDLTEQAAKISTEEKVDAWQERQQQKASKLQQPIPQQELQF